MLTFYHPDQVLHAPRQYMRLGKIIGAKDTPARAEALLDALTGAGMAIHTPPLAEREALLAVHTRPYLEFLESAYGRWQALPEAGDEVLPNVFPYWSAVPGVPARPPCPSPNIVAQAGYYLGDLGVPIGPHTWTSIVASASTAVAGADAVMGGADAAYALCRPSGHHARTDRANGFCYLNNAAIAAERLRGKFAKVAIVDVDAHHGDGTEAIFYHRSDVLTVSMHGDPANYYPYFTGYEAACANGAAGVANVNICLAPGSGDAQLAAAAMRAVSMAKDFNAEVLVVPLGFDTHKDDPLGTLRATSGGFRRLGEIIASAEIPTLIVQEGGYAVPALGACLTEFLAGMRN